MTANIDHMEFWAQLNARILGEKRDVQRLIDASRDMPEQTLRHLIGKREGLEFVRHQAREVFAEMTGTAVSGPDPEPEDDFPI